MRTAIESYRHILACLDNGTVNPAAQAEQATDGDNECVYEGANGVMCGVGCLLTQEQRDMIKASGFNEYSITMVARDQIISKDELEQTTGLWFTTLNALQDTHDTEVRAHRNINCGHKPDYYATRVGLTRAWVERQLACLPENQQ